MTVDIDKAKIREIVLELIKTDEEFRLTIAGAIGLQNILEELRRIHDDIRKLWLKSLEHDKRFEVLEKKLLEHDKRFEEMIKRFEVIEKKLLEHDKRFEEMNKRFEVIERKLLEHDKRFEAIERKLLEHDKRFEAIERKLLEHDKRFEAIEKKLLEHDRRFEAIEKKLLEHDKRFEAIERKLLEHDKKFDELNRRVSRIELELGALAESFYSRALLEDIREEVRVRGEKIMKWKRNARVDESDIDLLIETDKSVYVVEVKVKPKHEDVGVLLAKTDVVREKYPGKNVVAVLAGAMIGREVEEYARKKNILVYAY